MGRLSKSKLIAFRQCPKRLWLEVHRPELRDDSGSEAVFAVGHEVGSLAQEVLSGDEQGVNIDPNEIGWEESARQTAELLQKGEQAIFEALLDTGEAFALADIMRPNRSSEDLQWELIEVKASGSVKDYHRDDIAIQSYLARKNEIPLSKVGVAHVDTSFVYPGNRDYQGLFKIEDLTEEAAAREEEVQQWIDEAQAVTQMEEAPLIEMGPQCSHPFDCSFCAHCSEGIESPEDPFRMLPGRKKKIYESDHESLEELPENFLSPVQVRVRSSHLSGKEFFDAEVAKARSSAYTTPVYFLDFETFSTAVPLWTGTRPYENVPFQYSLHQVDAEGNLSHSEFLDLSGSDPREAMARQMIQDCGGEGAIFAYSASFERRIIEALIIHLPHLAENLSKLAERLVDLYPIAKECFYHPSQNGSWSLKAVAPAICPEIDYQALEGVQVGSDAAGVYFEACAPETALERREELRQQLLQYCKLDTLATVRIWERFTQ